MPRKGFLPSWVLLCVHVVQSCEVGETIEAEWTDGSYMLAKILEVRPGGRCGMYRITWVHTEVCMGHSSEYWGDNPGSNAFCVMGRESLRGGSCDYKPCNVLQSGAKSKVGTAKKEPKSRDDKSSVVIYAVLGAVSFPIVLICLKLFGESLCGRAQPMYDMESPAHASSDPSQRKRSPYDASPKSNVSSSPMHAWFDGARRLGHQIRSSESYPYKHKIFPQGTKPAISETIETDLNHYGCTEPAPDVRGYRNVIAQQQSLQLPAGQHLSRPSVVREHVVMSAQGPRAPLPVKLR